MSLVYEALQKAEREKGRKTGATSLTPAPIPVEPPVTAPIAASPVPLVEPAEIVSRPASTGYFAAVVACVSIVALAAIVYIIVIAARNVAQSQTVPSASPAPVNTVAAPVAPALPAASVAPVATSAAPTVAPAGSTANDPHFKLTGIMKLGDNFGAVVNGHIVYESQYVEGAIVKQIERDRVTLNVDGHDVVIRLF